MSVNDTKNNQIAIILTIVITSIGIITSVFTGIGFLYKLESKVNYNEIEISRLRIDMDKNRELIEKRDKEFIRDVLIELKLYSR